MKEFSEQEKILLEEMFISSAKISIQIETGDMDVQKMNRYLEFFGKRYQNLPGVETLKLSFGKRFYFRLSEDECANLERLKVKKRSTFEKYISLEELLFLARSFNYEQTYKDAFDVLKKRCSKEDLFRVAKEVDNILGCFIFHLYAYRYVVELMQGKELEEIINSIGDIYDSDVIRYYNVDKSYINFFVINSCYREVMKLKKSA